MSARHSIMPGSGVDHEFRTSLRTHLTDILGTELSIQEVDKIILDSPGEAEALNAAFKRMSSKRAVESGAWKGSNQWKRATQSSRPEITTAYDDHGYLTTEVQGKYSHGFLSEEKTELGMRALEGRRLLCSGLRDSVNEPCYRSLLEWVEHPCEAEAAKADDGTADGPHFVQEMTGDSVLGQSIYKIDKIFQANYDSGERAWRKAHKVADFLATPPEVVHELVAAAAEKTKADIDEAARQGKECSAGASLAIQVAAAVSANRAMEEVWSWCELEVTAEDDASTLLALLIDASVTKIPDNFGDHRTAGSVEYRLEKWLSKYMGSGGYLPEMNSGVRPMGRTDIDACVKQSGILQDGYIRRQIQRQREAKKAFQQYGGECVRFIFLLCLAAAYSTSRRVANEFPGRKNPTYAVFTPRNELVNGIPDSLSAHATTYLERMAALIHRSVGDDWAFDLEALRSQRGAKVLRFSRQVELYQHMVDGRSAAELSGIYQFLTKWKSGDDPL